MIGSNKPVAVIAAHFLLSSVAGHGFRQRGGRGRRSPRERVRCACPWKRGNHDNLRALETTDIEKTGQRISPDDVLLLALYPRGGIGHKKEGTRVATTIGPFGIRGSLRRLTDRADPTAVAVLPLLPPSSVGTHRKEFQPG